jgi:hypothetical protein
MASGTARPGATALFHGAAWRVASLAARVGFLALVVPRTIPGEFGIFFSYSSIGLLLARVLSYGAIDHLPTLVRGDATAMRQASRDLAPLFLLACAVTGGAVLVDSPATSAAAVALSMASGLMLAGAVRSVSPMWFERWMNLHPILLLVMAISLGGELRANELLILQAVALLAGQPLLLRFATQAAPSLAGAVSVSWPARIRGLLGGGHTRMLSDTLISACLRGIAIGPVILGAGAISDSLALALAFGEAIWTVGMILVHRNFAYYCASGPDRRHSVRSAALLLGGVSALGAAGTAAVLAFTGLELFQRVEPMTLLPSFAFFAGVTALSEFRYFDVAAGKSLTVWIVAQMVFVVLSAMAPGVLGEEGAIWCIAAIAVLPALIIIGRSWRAVRSTG